jgi:N-methylhydantoinase B
LTGLADDPAPDHDATRAARDGLRAARPLDLPFFDRGPGYARLAGGRVAAAVDWL